MDIEERIEELRSKVEVIGQELIALQHDVDKQNSGVFAFPGGVVYHIHRRKQYAVAYNQPRENMLRCYTYRGDRLTAAVFAFENLQADDADGAPIIGHTAVRP